MRTCVSSLFLHTVNPTYSTCTCTYTDTYVSMCLCWVPRKIAILSDHPEGFQYLQGEHCIRVVVRCFGLALELCWKVERVMVELPCCASHRVESSSICATISVWGMHSALLWCYHTTFVMCLSTIKYANCRKFHGNGLLGELNGMLVSAVTTVTPQLLFLVKKEILIAFTAGD